MKRIFSGISGTIAKGAIVLGTSAFVVDNFLFNVEPGHRGIMFDRLNGILPKTYSEGTHFMFPILQRPIILDVRTQPRTINTETGTKDLQNVQLSLRVLARPSVPQLPTLFKNLGADYAERVLPSLTNEVLKQVVALYDADQLLTLRDKVSQALRESLTSRCREFNIELDDVSITHLSFSKDFSKAIEDKQVAEQMAERAKFIVQKAEQDKLAQITRAEGDAEAAQLVSDAIGRYGTGLIEIRRIETAVSIADSLSKTPNITYLPSNANPLLAIGGTGGSGSGQKH